ncbi:MAG: hypothetical protein WAW13_03630 [Minisyncoccia bacterium]
MAPRASIKNAKEKMGTPAFIGGVLTVGLLAIVGAVFIGTSDDGQINVTAAIQNSNQANTDAGGDASGNVEAIPETFKNMPNGGLVSQGEQPAPPVVEQAPEESISETGTTTSESDVATTTEAVQGEGESVTSVE